jgi:hypothetical protein
MDWNWFMRRGRKNLIGGSGETSLDLNWNQTVLQCWIIDFSFKKVEKKITVMYPQMWLCWFYFSAETTVLFTLAEKYKGKN